MKKNKIENREDWDFNGMEKYFDEHVSKSVPLYKYFHNTIRDMIPYFLKDNTKIVDVGTSTGTTLLDIYELMGDSRSTRYVGLDISKDMILYCKSKYDISSFFFEVKNALEYNYLGSNITILMLTLQFLSISERALLLKKIYSETRPGDAVFIVEKIKTSDLEFHDIYGDLYYDFKKKSFTEKEILDKNIQLRGIMKPISLEANLKILSNAGYTRVEIPMRYQNFALMVAIK